MEELFLELEDKEWEFTGVKEERHIARAIAFDDNGFFYFLRVVREDEFADKIEEAVDGIGGARMVELIETSGGGIEDEETPEIAVIRELKEELGADAEIICKIGVVKDYYNLIQRRNINNYFLCKINSFGEKNMTKDEAEVFNLSTLKLTYDEALEEYERCSNAKKSDKSKLGTLIAQREVPMLIEAKKILEKI